MTAPPSRIPEYIYIGRPECQSFVDISVIVGRKFIIFCPSFCCHTVCYHTNKFIIKRCCHANCLWENRRCPSPRHPVQTFVPPIISRNSQPADGGRIIFQLACTLLQCHLTHKLFCPVPCLFPFHTILFLSLFQIFLWITIHFQIIISRAL